MYSRTKFAVRTCFNSCLLQHTYANARPPALSFRPLSLFKSTLWRRRRRTGACVLRLQPTPPPPEQTGLHTCSSSRLTGGASPSRRRRPPPLLQPPSDCSRPASQPASIAGQVRKRGREGRGKRKNRTCSPSWQSDRQRTAGRSHVRVRDNSRI